MELKNITLGEYLAMDDQTEYDFYMKYSTALNTCRDHLHIGDMMQQPFGVIKDLQFDLVQGMNWTQVQEYMMKLSGRKCADISAMPLDKFCQTWKYVQDEIGKISEVESIALAYIATDEERRAGIEKLSDLGAYLQFRSVAQSLHMTIDQVRDMKYEDAFLELVAQKMLSDYDRELYRIRAEAAKR